MIFMYVIKIQDLFDEISEKSDERVILASKGTSKIDFMNSRKIRLIDYILKEMFAPIFSTFQRKYILLNPELSSI